jgi:hypothetical protein
VNGGTYTLHYSAHGSTRWCTDPRRADGRTLPRGFSHPAVDREGGEPQVSPPGHSQPLTVKQVKRLWLQMTYAGSVRRIELKRFTPK